METVFKLILISPESTVKNEHKILCQLFEEGLALYHLRKSYWNLSEIRSYLVAIPEEFHNRIVLHSHFELTGEFGVKGIHLNEQNKGLYSELGNQKIISASFHSLEEIKENDKSYDYVFLSPIFDSISKEGYQSNFDLNELREDLATLKNQKQHTKIIALGGIDAKNIVQIQQIGFAGTALLGAVWQSENAVQSFLQIQALGQSKG